MNQGLRFTEFMSGHVTFGEADAARGAHLGRASGTRLSLFVAVEIADVGEEVEVDGYVWCEALGSQLPFEHATFALFPDVGSARVLMRYRVFFRDAVGHALTLIGVKVISGSPGLRVWHDATTLHARVLWGHVEHGGGDPPSDGIVASGVLRLRPLAFARQLASFRASGPTTADRLRTIARFDAAFLAHLWTVYGPRALRG